MVEQTTLGWDSKPLSLITEDGDVCLYSPELWCATKRPSYDDVLTALEWEQHYVQMYGKQVASPRLSAWYGDSGAAYQYSGTRYLPKVWVPELLAIKEQVERVCGQRFNSCLANWYRDGKDGMGWHADNEPELGPEPVIASVSLGATRVFSLRHVHGSYATLKQKLNDGDLLVMRGKLQQYWQHSVPKTRKSVDGRINLTFRLIDAKEF